MVATKICSGMTLEDRKAPLMIQTPYEKGTKSHIVIYSHRQGIGRGLEVMMRVVPQKLEQDICHNVHP